MAHRMSGTDFRDLKAQVLPSQSPGSDEEKHIQTGTSTQHTVLDCRETETRDPDSAWGISQGLSAGGLERSVWSWFFSYSERSEVLLTFAGLHVKNFRSGFLLENLIQAYPKGFTQDQALYLLLPLGALLPSESGSVSVPIGPPDISSSNCHPTSCDGVIYSKRCVFDFSLWF